MARRFDESGQVFSESQCVAGPMVDDWEDKTQGQRPDVVRVRTSAVATSSLFDVALHNCLVNSSSIRLDHLRSIPWDIGQLLYERLEDNYLVSFRIWKAFVLAYPKAMELRKRPKTILIVRACLPIQSYIARLDPPETQWLTVLDLHCVDLPYTALVRLSGMRSLTALCVWPSTENRVDDRLLRAWGRAAATNDKAFANLKVLAVLGHPPLTTRSYSYLDWLPCLDFVFETCDGRASAKRKAEAEAPDGWHVLTKAQALEMADIDLVAHTGLEIHPAVDRLIEAVVSLEHSSAPARVHAVMDTPNGASGVIRKFHAPRILWRKASGRKKPDHSVLGLERPTRPLQKSRISKAIRVKASQQQDLDATLMGLFG